MRNGGGGRICLLVMLTNFAKDITDDRKLRNSIQKCINRICFLAWKIHAKGAF